MTNILWSHLYLEFGQCWSKELNGDREWTDGQLGGRWWRGSKFQLDRKNKIKRSIVTHENCRHEQFIIYGNLYVDFKCCHSKYIYICCHYIYVYIYVLNQANQLTEAN